jgi:hypothetical protein
MFLNVACYEILPNHDAKKSEMFNDFFYDQSNINDDYLIPPDLDGPLYEKLIIITETDVDDILKTLNVHLLSPVHESFFASNLFF